MTAREQAIKVAARVLFTEQYKAEAVVGALLAATFETDCETCGGTGRGTPRDIGTATPLPRPCRSCNGTRRVSRSLLAVLAAEQEQTR